MIALPEAIDVRVHHRTMGSMSIPSYVQQDCDSRDFRPWLDITTWTRRFEVRVRDQQYFPGHGKAKILGNNNVLVTDKLALEVGEVHALCLRAPHDFNHISTNIVNIEGLLVVQVAEGLYRRIGPFKSWVGPETIERALAGSGQLKNYIPRRGLEERVAYFRDRPGWQEPSMLGRLGNEAWTRQTLRII